MCDVPWVLANPLPALYTRLWFLITTHMPDGARRYQHRSRSSHIELKGCWTKPPPPPPRRKMQNNSDTTTRSTVHRCSHSLNGSNHKWERERDWLSLTSEPKIFSFCKNENETKWEKVSAAETWSRQKKVCNWLKMTKSDLLCETLSMLVEDSSKYNSFNGLILCP